MAVNEKFVGRTFTGSPPYEVSRGKIGEFSHAVGATHPAHFDRDAAGALGLSDVVAPATFAVIPAQIAEREYLEAAGNGIEFDKVVHGGEEFTYARPIVAGDVLCASLHIDAIKVRPNVAFITSTCTLTGAAGDVVATATSTIAQRA